MCLSDREKYNLPHQLGLNFIYFLETVWWLFSEQIVVIADLLMYCRFNDAECHLKLLENA
jgi:hypothetical protein